MCVTSECLGQRRKGDGGMKALESDVFVLVFSSDMAFLRVDIVQVFEIGNWNGFR